MVEILLFSAIILSILYWAIRSLKDARFHETFLALGVAILSTQIFIVAYFSGQFFREVDNASVNRAIQVVGLCLIIEALVLLATSFVSKRKMSSLVSLWGDTQVFMAQGVYGVVRYPIHLAGILAATGTALMMANIAVIALALLASATFYVASREEDRFGTLNLGVEYARYMSAVPAFNLVLGLSRSRRNR